MDTVYLGCWPRNIFNWAGFFDEELVRNQDDEFNFRMTRAGYKIYFNPGIRSRYYVRTSFKKLGRQYFQYGYWKVYVNKKHKVVTSLRQLVPFAFVAYLLLLSIPVLLTVFNTTLLPLLLVSLFPAALYLVASTAFAIRLSGSVSLRTWYLLRSFCYLHLYYGSGYLKGLWDFVVLNKRPASKSRELSR